MKEEIRADIAQVAGRMHYFKDNRNNLEEAYRITGEEMLTSILEDFDGRFANLTLYPSWAKGEVIGLDMDLIHEGKKFPLRLMTQNPKKRNKNDQRYLSEYAKLAQQGHEITWVTLREGNELKWLGKVVDDKYIKKGEEEVEIKVEEVMEPVNTMAEYVSQLAHGLPHVDPNHIIGVVTLANKLGMLK